MKTKDELLTEIMLEKTHLSFVNEELEKIYDKESEWSEEDKATINFLMNEKQLTLTTLNALKKDYSSNYGAPNLFHTGKIEICYDSLPNDAKWELYRFLNNFVQKNTEASYRTVEDSAKYSKDFNYESSGSAPCGYDDEDTTKEQ